MNTVPATTPNVNFVTFEETVRHTTYDSPIYNVIPRIFTDIANKSRCDSGFRLLMRCARHTMDSKSITKRLQGIQVIKTEDGTLAFNMTCEVPASMKESTYVCRACISEDGKLLCCQCDCKVGSKVSTTQTDKKTQSTIHIEAEW